MTKDEQIAEIQAHLDEANNVIAELQAELAKKEAATNVGESPATIEVEGKTYHFTAKEFRLPSGKLVTPATITTDEAAHLVSIGAGVLKLVNN